MALRFDLSPTAAREYVDPGAEHGRSEERPDRQSEQADQDRGSEGTSCGRVRGRTIAPAPVLPWKTGPTVTDAIHYIIGLRPNVDARVYVTYSINARCLYV